MKSLSIIALCIFGWFVTTPFDVVETTYQKSVGGRAESGVSHTYTVKMVAKADSKKLHFTDLWVDTLWFEANAYRLKDDHSYSNEFSKGDTIYIMVSRRTFPAGDKEGFRDFYKPGKKAPEYDGAGLIGYEYKGKPKFYIIKEFKTLKAVYMP